MNKIFFDHGYRPHELEMSGWTIFKKTMLATQLPALRSDYSSPAGEVTIVVSHHVYDISEIEHLADVARNATGSAGAFFFVYVSRGDPAVLRNRHRPASGIFACHSEALPKSQSDCKLLLQGKWTSNLGKAIAAINTIAPDVPVAEQAQEVRRILDTINGSAADDESFYSAVAMLLVRKALESGQMDSVQTPALAAWAGNQSDNSDTVAQLEEKVLKRFRSAGG